MVGESFGTAETVGKVKSVRDTLGGLGSEEIWCSDESPQPYVRLRGEVTVVLSLVS